MSEGIEKERELRGLPGMGMMGRGGRGVQWGGLRVG